MSSDQENAEAERALPSRLREYVRSERIKLPRRLFQRSRLQTLRHAATPFGFVAGALVVARAALPLPAKLPLQFVLLLAAHRGFQTQVHDLSHRLFSKDLKLNDLLGNLLAAGFTGNHIQAYRRIHFQHHAHNGSARDPEYISFEKVRQQGGLGRYVMSYALGLQAPRLFKKYYASGESAATSPSAANPTPSEPPQRHGWKDKWPIPVTQLALFSAFTWIGQAPWLYGLWVYQAVTWSPLLSGLRFMVEHPGESDVTVTTLSPLLERIFFAPFNFNYHFEHHVWPTLPPYQLQAAHRYLRSQGYYTRHSETLGRGFLQQLVSKV